MYKYRCEICNPKQENKPDQDRIDAEHLVEVVNKGHKKEKFFGVRKDSKKALEKLEQAVKDGVFKKSSPSLLNDIETIEEIFIGRKKDSHLETINSLIKNQRILTEIIKSLLIK
jgi:hypothetical protein